MGEGRHNGEMGGAKLSVLKWDAKGHGVEKKERGSCTDNDGMAPGSCCCRIQQTMLSNIHLRTKTKTASDKNKFLPSDDVKTCKFCPDYDKEDA